MAAGYQSNKQSEKHSWKRRNVGTRAWERDFGMMMDGYQGGQNVVTVFGRSRA